MRIAIEKFNGEQLQQALDARKWSVGMLAEMSDISESMLYYLINNEKKPSHETLVKISSTLKLPETFFCKKQEVEFTHSFFRSLKRSAKTSRISVDVKIKWVSNIRNFLSNYVEFPKLNLPDLDDFKDRDPHSLTLNEIEDLAQKVREFWDLHNSVIQNTTLLFENNGLFVTKFTIGSEDVDALSKVDITNNNPYILLSSDKNSRSRTKFDNAHELGHYLLHSALDTKLFDVGKKDNHDLLEEQANRFAGAFLLPEVSFSRDFAYPTLEHYKVLKSKWKVSIALLVYRSHQLELINDRTYKNLQINISKRGWRKNEPLEDLIELETPSLAQRAFDLIFKEKLISVQEMEDKIGLFSAEIEKICGLEKGFFDKYKLEQQRPVLRLVK
ncbi:MAG: XRE family transcriptional regulator [Balneola sp.]